MNSAVALAAAVILLVAACGTRVDRDTIARAAAGSGAAAGPGGEEYQLGDGGIPEAGAGKKAGGSRAGVPGAGTGNGPAAGPAQAGGPSGTGPGATAGPGGQGRAASGAPLVIGTVGAYSGPGGTALAQGARALQVWGAQVNANGGVNGHPVKVIVMDDAGDAAKARALMKELVDDRKAVAVVGAMTVVETLNAWRDFVHERQVPVIGGSCGPEWTAQPMLFRQCPQSPEQVYGTALIGAKFGRSKEFGGMFCSETASCTFVEDQLFDKGGAKRAGLNPRYRARMSVFQADFTAECIQARNSGVELLMVVADPGTVERVASSCRRQGYTPQFLQIASTVRAEAVTRPGLGDMVVGMSVFPFAGVSSPAVGEFNAAWARYGGGQAPGPAAAQGWASAKLFEKAVRAAGSNITRASLIKALRGLRGERLGGLTAPMTFGANGAAAVPCTYYMRGVNGKWAAPNGDRLICW